MTKRKEIPVKEGFIWLNKDGKIMFTHDQGYTMKMTYRDIYTKIFDTLYEPQPTGTLDK